MKCKLHEDREAIAMCVYCGAAFCGDCLVEINGKMYCKEHVEKAFEDKKEVSKQNKNSGPVINIVNNNKNTNINKNTNNSGRYYNIPRKKRMVALVLCILFGLLGAHRFYVGKIGSGLIYLFTLGLFGIGWVIDIFRLLDGGFKDSLGRRLV